MVFNTAKGKQSWAMYADIGHSNQIREGSMKLNKDLGLSDSQKTGGTEEEIIAMIYFPGSAIGWPAPMTNSKPKPRNSSMPGAATEAQSSRCRSLTGRFWSRSPLHRPEKVIVLGSGGARQQGARDGVFD
jgi:hypothetical protein